MLLHDKIRDAYVHPQFIADVIKPLQIEQIMDQEVGGWVGGWVGGCWAWFVLYDRDDHNHISDYAVLHLTKNAGNFARHRETFSVWKARRNLDGKARCNVWQARENLQRVTCATNSVTSLCGKRMETVFWCMTTTEKFVTCGKCGKPRNMKKAREYFLCVARAGNL